MKLYKFLPKIYLDSFFDSGCLKLGTIYNFKDIINHTIARGDAGEGSHKVEWNSGDNLVVTRESNSVLPLALRIDTDIPVTLSNVRVISNRYCNDSHIYCTSREYSDELFARWRECDADTNSCFVINEPDFFINSISKAIIKSARFDNAGSIIYIDEPLVHNSFLSELDPAFTKNRSEYQWQREHRVSWQPKLPTPPLSPWIIYVPEARQYCSPYKLFHKDQIIDL
ncbi:hypothetical protein UXP90_23555 [Enterobacter kobei]|uniref:hypothetical protein n=1 Tax=Enterobacter kobei TaxID=208224 RepID=UPI002FD6642B